MSVSDREEKSEDIFAKRVEKRLFQLKKISRAYDIPYLAGYSKDRKTLYIDKDSAKGFDGIDTDRYLAIHEYVEDSCEENGADYVLGHALATLAELGAVAADGVDVDAYNAFMAKEVKKAESKKKFDLPSDLDMQPYITDDPSKALLKKMGYYV